jgi:hypothetical protein
MATTRSFAASRPRAWAWRATLLLALALLALVAAAIAVRHQRWHVSLQDVRFVDHHEKVTGGKAALTVTGYLIATVESDVDFFRLAREENAYPQVRAALCDSGATVGAWRDPLPIERHAADRRFVYAVLVPVRGHGVDLAQSGEDVCLRFLASGAGPLAWVGSRPVTVPIAAGLREQLRDYVRREGAVDLVLDPACAPQLCQPDFSNRALKH